MYKPVEERVTEIVSNSPNLTPVEQHDIAYLIEVYRSADYIIKDMAERNKKVLDYIKTIERRGSADIKDIWWIKHLILGKR